MNLEDLFKLKSFEDNSYGAIALERWRTLKSQQEYFPKDRVISRRANGENATLACECFFKHIITRTEGYDKSHLYTHSLMTLARDIHYNGRQKHAVLLRRMSIFYQDCRYEPKDEDKADYLDVLDYFAASETYEELDELLFDLYSLAQDAERHRTFQVKAECDTHMHSHLKTMDLFGNK